MDINTYGSLWLHNDEYYTIYIFPDYFGMYVEKDHEYNIQDTVLECIEVDHFIVLLTKNGAAAYSKKTHKSYYAKDIYCLMYDHKLHYFDNAKNINSYHEENETNRSVRSLAEFARFIREKYNEEFDPLKVNHGTVVYSRKPDPMIKRSDKLSDIDIISVDN